MTYWFAASYVTVLTIVNAILFLCIVKKIDRHLAEMANHEQWVHLMLKNGKCEVCRDLEGVSDGDE